MGWSLGKTWNHSPHYLVKLLTEPGKEARGWGMAQLRRAVEELGEGFERCRMGEPVAAVGVLGVQGFTVARPFPWFGPDARATCEVGEDTGWTTGLLLDLSQFSILIRPLFESFNGMVSTASLQSLRQTSLAWLDQHCSLPALRPST